MYSVVEQNLRAAMRCYAFIGNGSEARDYPGLYRSFLGSERARIQLRDADRSHRANLDTPDRNGGRCTFGRAGSGGRFGSATICSRPAARIEVCERSFRSQGMLRIASPPGMYAEKSRLAVKPPAPLTFARVVHRTTRGWNLRTSHRSCFHCRLAPPSGSTARPDCGSRRHMVGWDISKGRPCAIVTIVIASDAIGVYSLGTFRSIRDVDLERLCCVTRSMRRASETGLNRSVLQATQQGINLYLRMGYRVVTKFSIYMREGCASF